MLQAAQGDMVVIPGVGVGSVEGVSMMTVGGKELQFTRIACGRRLESMYVPTLDMQGKTRAPILEGDIDRLLAIVSSSAAPAVRANWNQRRRRYVAMVVSDDPLELAALLGELDDVRSRKHLSFQESVIYERVHDMLVDEIAVAQHSERPAAEERLGAALSTPFTR